MMVIPGRTIIKTRINKDIAADKPVELKGEGILPLQFRTAIGSVSVQARLPRDIVRKLPSKIGRELRTVIGQGMLAFI